MSMGAMQGRASAGDAGAAKVRGVATGCPSGRETDGHRLTRARDVGHIQGAPQVGCWKNEECLQQSVLFSQGKTWSSASEGWEGVLDV